jgi:hypothetical protein
MVRPRRSAEERQIARILHNASSGSAHHIRGRQRWT